MQPIRLLTVVTPIMTSIIVLVAPATLAQPHVESVSGDLVQGVTLIIYGSGFGTKSPAGPALVDRPSQDAGITDGDLVSTGGSDPWQRVLPLADSVRYSTVSPRTTGGATYRATARGYLSRLNQDDAAPSRLLVNWWVRASEDLDAGISDRLIRVRTHPDDMTSEVTLSHDRLKLIPDVDHDGAPEPAQYLHGHWGASAQAWINLELQIDSNGLQTGRGEVTVRADGAVIHQAVDCWAAAPLNDIVLLGFHALDPELEATPVVDWTDIYVDTTFARVLISNSPQAHQGSRCELQTPVSWSTNQITIQATTGSFSAGESVYLFVVDEEGTWAQYGYEIYVGDDTVPGMPGQPISTD